MDDSANTKKMNICNKLCFLLVLTSVILVDSKKHKLKVENDVRKTIDLTTFGFLQDGFLQVNITGFTTGLEKPEEGNGNFGFTLTKLDSTGKSLLEGKESACILKATDRSLAAENMALIVLNMDFGRKMINIQRHGKDVQNLTLSTELHDQFDIPVARRRRSSSFLRDSVLLPAPRVKRQAPGSGTVTPTKPTVAVKIPSIPVILPDPDDKKDQKAPPSSTSTKQPVLLPDASKTGTKKPEDTNPNKSPTTSQSNDSPKAQSVPAPKQKSHQATKPTESGTKHPGDGDIMDSFHMDRDEAGSYSFLFVAEISDKGEEGLYEFYFHNCLSSDVEPARSSVNFSAYLIEKNGDNYLSAGHIPLPVIFFSLSVVFFGMACVWLYILKRSTEGVYKLHYLMLSLVYIKALSMLFHAINYHFMAQQGHHEEAIAIIYYITYLTRGILLFVTIVLIGAGWAFVKYILSDRDKKIFIVVIPLQILANVAQIVVEETEEGESQYITWSEIFIIVDLLCCGAILFPVVWSIRHLQDASQTDGKAAINLVKLKLFRHFYIMIVCYIYFTRIIVYLLRIAVPFKYVWMDDLFRELATLAFYVVTGYKFRPASDNPYLQVPQDSDDELEMDEVVTQSGALEGLTKVNVKFKGGNGDSTTSASKRESSHEYD